jgi:hypothetical protein
LTTPKPDSTAPKLKITVTSHEAHALAESLVQHEFSISDASGISRPVVPKSDELDRDYPAFMTFAKQVFRPLLFSSPPT